MGNVSSAVLSKLWFSRDIGRLLDITSDNRFLCLLPGIDWSLEDNFERLTFDFSRENFMSEKSSLILLDNVFSRANPSLGRLFLESLDSLALGVWVGVVFEVLSILTKLSSLDLEDLSAVFILSR